MLPARLAIEVLLEGSEKKARYIKKPFEKETLVILKEPLGFEIWKAWPSVFSPASFYKLLGYEIVSN